MRIPGTKYSIRPANTGGGCLMQHDATVKDEEPISVAGVSYDGTVTILSAVTERDVKGILFRGMCQGAGRQAGVRWPMGSLLAVGVDALPSWFLGEHLATKRQL